MNHFHDNTLQRLSVTRTTASRRSRCPRGFTLVELLVVIAIIGVMVGMGLPAVQASRESARRTECTSNLARLLMAVHSYQSAHAFLPSGTLDAQGPIRSEPQGFHQNWIAQSLPYLDEMNIYRHIDHKQSVYAPANAAVRQISLAVLRCPSEGTDAANNFGISSYAGSHHDVEAPIDVDNHGIFFLNSRLRDEDVRDGLAHTIFLAEKRVDADDLGWMSGTRATLRNAGTPINGARVTAQAPTPNPTAPTPADEAAIAPAAPNASAQQVTPDNDAETDATEAVDGQVGQPAVIQPIQTPVVVTVDPLYVGGFSSAHPLQANIAFGDGNVRLLSTSIDPLVLQQLAHRDDGKLLNALDR
ncbi:MAG TPA: DUF1559 domain-containing protein [Pirellulales bacterium]|jgi:prepilin-type N-terminal cleavage/methylation domain-containing protein/prepilin-type processing-associated H-X9-DG protein